MKNISLQDIVKTKEFLNKQIIRTPLTYSSLLSELVDCDVYLKLENLQLTGAYKVRGALNKISNPTVP